ncbi:Trifunctional NAD biosynthesis/regulator protein NadR [Aquisphaera giovannonii]|uniref:Trifunctional NAD biosynthesis/regulator protein NadR n=1 Tax=Aquisphaera giovannonii TaxID=406548 RepID=A0A5B9W1J8_9BACT|nr:AAA family ATPase [Aquisphaera giovannonii]QEH34466.1 Trifunctional NAD biosynthesis/regulator protein NadR [Aquisphaera giovannonii]
MTLGFIVGKFYPPHRGHKHLIDTARRQVDHLVVMVAHHPSQAIPGELRKAWLEEIHPDCDVRLVPDELEDDSRQWAQFTVRYLGRAPDVVFTSEDYGWEYARLMGTRHVLVDRPRAAVPISGTKVRESPLDHLEWLEPCVRAHFVRRVVLVGAESTGKTTLAQRLAVHYHTAWVPEYGREHWEKKVAGLPMDGPTPAWTREEFVHIATEQRAREEALARVADRVLICDTNAFATGTWFERYEHHRDPEVDAIGARDRADLYLLAAPDVPFVQDGFRDGERIRGWMHDRFLEQLMAGGVPCRVLEGPFEGREAGAIAAIDGLLREPRPVGGTPGGRR